MLRGRRRIVGLVLFVIVIAIGLGWSRLIQAMLPADSRPGKISFETVPVTDTEFAEIAASLHLEHPDLFSGGHDGQASHIDYFEDAGIRSYDGPSTCLECHSTLTVTDADGRDHEVPLMADLTDSVHYRFFSKSHPNVWGFNGENADGFSMGKVNRPCPKPGSFAMTAWAEVVTTEDGRTFSEGCGQCHIGGQYQAPLGEMMPLYRTLSREKEAIDCLICHAVAYDMNRKEVVTDADGRNRWGQDRSMKAALSVTTPTAVACLRCHQHNLGGDLYIDPAGPEFSQSLANLGANRPRVRHPGSKRGTPYTPSWDVHAAAGLSCLDCHATEGHRIAKGTHTTTMMANDLPRVEVDCTGCHTAEPHDADSEDGPWLNGHVDRLACQTCHIPSLHPDNVSRRDFSTTEFEEDQGIFVYRDDPKLTEPGEGIHYVWWNGDGSFLGNPIGENPNGVGLYTFYNAENRWPEFADFDYQGWYDRVMRPIARQGRPSKIYPMKRFNGRQHIDLANIGPFGGMFVPYNLPEYYRSGDADLAARKEMEKSMMGRMYGWMFKFYMLDRFMGFMEIDGWSTGAYDDVLAGRNVEPRWIPTDAMLEISHAIRLEGALRCDACHGPDGVMDWRALGYTETEIEELSRARTDIEASEPNTVER